MTANWRTGEPVPDPTPDDPAPDGRSSDAALPAEPDHQHRYGAAVTSGGLRWITLAEANATHPVRPNPLRWLAYAVGAGLPERHREWVLKDTTTSTWILRHLSRSLLMLVLPVALVLLLLPTNLGLRILTAVVAGGCGLMFMLVHIIEVTERRIVRAGYVGGTAERLRGERSVEAQRAGNQLRRERLAARKQRSIARRAGDDRRHLR